MSAAVEPHSEIVSFDAAVFDLDTVKRAVYRLTAHFSADISVEGPRIVCKLSFKSSISAPAVAGIVADLKKEVLDQDLRRKIAAETAPIRNAILALAFSNPKLRGDE